MSKQKSLITILWVTMTSLYVILACLLVYLWVGKELRNTRSQIDNIRETYISSQKELIKTQVKQAVEYTRHKKSLAEKRVRSEVKSRTDEAYETALYIYNSHKSDRSLRQIKKLVHDALFAASWDDGKGYYFAEDMTGIEMINRNNPELEGTNVLNIQDSRGTFVMKQILAAARSPEKEGFCSYYWNKPEHPGVFVPKISYVKYFEPFDWVIGNGKYLVDEEEKIKKEVINRIEQIKYGSDSYIFAGTWDGLSLSGPFTGKNMIDITDSNGVKIVEELIGAAKSGGGFVEYVAPKFKGQTPAPKISYAEPIPEWEWYIGTGVYVDAIEAVILQKQKELKRDVRSLILQCVLVFSFFLVLSFLLVGLLSRKIKKNLDVFIQFFERSASEALPIEEDKIFFTEFQSLAVSANQMSLERQKSNRALQESEKQYRQLFNNAPAGIYEIDLIKSKFTKVNDVMCKYSGYSEEEFLSMDPPDLLAEHSRTKLFQRLERLFDGEQTPDNVEYDIIKKDGEELCVILTNDFIYEKGVLKGARVVVHDISKRKRAEEEKINAQKIAGEQKKLALVGQIAGKMAHDFNNILGIVMGNTELLLMDCEDEYVKNKLELIFKQTLRGKNLTKNLVAFAKDQEPKQEFFKINEKMDLVISLMEKDLKDVSLIKENEPGMPDLLADPGMIEHALVNLLQNSIHATSMSESPRIILRTYCLDGNIFFEIEDNGCGIPKEHLKDVYSPSFTLKGSRDKTGSYKGSIKGTGYGMANVKKYIEQHNGSIFVESKLDTGTKFTIVLPVIEKELTREEKMELREETTCFEKTILLVEDETAISEVQYRILTQDPCNNKVDIANSGQAAMNMFDRNEYDFISLDYALPGNLNGMDVYKHIRKTNKTIPILFVSGNIEFLESIKDLKQKDLHIDHQSKPCQNKEYVTSINRLLGKK